MLGICACVPVTNTMPKATNSITTVLIAVAKLESTFCIPTFANIAVSAAKTADSSAYIFHIGSASFCKFAELVNYKLFFLRKYFCAGLLKVIFQKLQSAPCGKNPAKFPRANMSLRIPPPKFSAVQARIRI